jgi:hypothetical protein
VAKTPAPKQNSSLIKILVVGVVVVGVLFKMTEPEPVTKKKASNRPTGQSTSSSKKKKDTFTKEDYSAQFASVETEMKNSFKPVIASKSTNSMLQQLTTNGIPALFAGGDPNWIYTGNMEIDGVPNALLENTSTGEGAYLRPGERWKQCTLKVVTEGSITLEGPSGYVKTIKVGTNDVQPVDPAAAGISPLPPAGNSPRTASGNLSGPIGPLEANIGDNSGEVPTENRRRNRRNR